MMLDLGTIGTKKEAARAYDAVTQAINGWIMAHARTVPKGLHMKLLLTSCLTLNMCWIDRSPHGRADILACWHTITQAARKAIRKRRAREYYEWKRGNEEAQVQDAQDKGDVPAEATDGGINRARL